MLLLERRYAMSDPHSFQRVPDRRQGDLGIEAFAMNGTVYQCYAAEEPLSVRECFEKQRDKLTRDLRKLRENATHFRSMLGGTVIRRYVFLVHRHDARQLIDHASSKATEVRSWGLDFIGPEFRIVIETLDNYRQEQEAVHSIPRPLVLSVAASAGETDAWRDGHQSLLDTAETKLSTVISSSAERSAIVDSLALQHLEAENALERLRELSAESYQAVLRTRAQRERLLVLEYPPSANQYATLTTIARELAAALLDSAPTIDREFAESLAWSSVMDWLMRCPLAFEAET